MFGILIVLSLSAALALPLLRALGNSGRLPRPLADVVEATKPIRSVQLACLAGVFLIAWALEGEGGALVLGLLAVVLLLGYLTVWAQELLFLMSLTDEDFPGRFDKPIWAMVMVALGPLGLWTFRRYRAERWIEPTAEEPPTAQAKPATTHDWW